MTRKSRNKDQSEHDLTQENQVEGKKHFTQKVRSFFKKTFLILTLILCAYFGLKYLKYHQEQKLKAAAEVEKFDNVDSEIFDLSDEYKGQEPGEEMQILPDVTAEEMKEKNAEFVYQSLLKNHVQINELREEVRILREEIQKYKSQEKIGKIVFTYIDLRQRMFASVPHEETLRELEILVTTDEKLQEKVTKLKSFLPQFPGEEKLKKNFQNLIPEIIVAKTNSVDQSFIAKVRRNISRLVVVRRIDEKNPRNVDGIVAQTERFLRERRYQEAMISILSLDQHYHEILKDFLDDLTAAVGVQEADQEILNYLKNLS